MNFFDPLEGLYPDCVCMNKSSFRIIDGKMVVICKTCFKIKKTDMNFVTSEQLQEIGKEFIKKFDNKEELS